jgi:hypothetical protein
MEMNMDLIGAIALDSQIHSATQGLHPWSGYYSMEIFRFHMRKQVAQ